MKYKTKDWFDFLKELNHPSVQKYKSYKEFRRDKFGVGTTPKESFNKFYNELSEEDKIKFNQI